MDKWHAAESVIADSLIESTPQDQRNDGCLGLWTACYLLNPVVRVSGLFPSSFQSDLQLDLIGDLDAEAGLYSKKLQEEAVKRAEARKREAAKAKFDFKDREEKTDSKNVETEDKQSETKETEGEAKDDNDDDEPKVWLTLCADYCPDPELVKEHLDGGVLAKMVKDREPVMMGKKKGGFFNPRYELILLGACAMTLGCTLPTALKNWLKKNYHSAGLMEDAVDQMDKALHSPNGFKDGEPYDFESPGLLETVNRMADEEIANREVDSKTAEGPADAPDDGEPKAKVQKRKEDGDVHSGDVKETDGAGKAV